MVFIHPIYEQLSFTEKALMYLMIMLSQNLLLVLCFRQYTHFITFIKFENFYIPNHILIPGFRVYDCEHALLSSLYR